QLILMKGRRPLASWIARATSSFPVPVSPRTRTVASVGATISTCFNAWRRLPLLPMIGRATRSAAIRGIESSERFDDCADCMVPLMLSPPRRARWIHGRVFFPGDPLANVRGAVLQSDACRFTTSEEADGVAVDKPYLLEVERDHVVRSVFVDQPLQLGDVLAFEATAEHKPHVVGVD